MQILELGLKDYSETLDIMNKIHSDVSAAKSADTLIVVEHPPTVTMGNRERYEDMHIPPEELKFKGVKFVKVDRGGSVTIHEPGQIVIYPILSLKNLSVKKYVCALEEAMILTCKHYGVIATRDPINPGVWVGENKIGALGIRVANRVSKHGLAFNIDNSLETFGTIVPCGLHGRGVTSLQRESDKNLDHLEVESYIVNITKELLNNLKN